MEIVFTAGEFRSKMKEALDAVAKGKSVTIVRGTELFLVQKGQAVVSGTPLPKNTAIVTPPPKNTDVSDLLTPEKSELTPRSKGDVLADIRELEAERDEELRIIQDPSVAATTTNAYAKRIQPLWDEYHNLEA